MAYQVSSLSYLSGGWVLRGRGGGGSPAVQNQKAVSAHLKVSRYCLLALHDKAGQSLTSSAQVNGVLIACPAGDVIQQVGCKVLPFHQHDRWWEGIFIPISQQTRHIYPLFDQCWANVVDVGPTLVKQWVDVSCLLGRCRLVVDESHVCMSFLYNGKRRRATFSIKIPCISRPYMKILAPIWKSTNRRNIFKID